MTIFLAPQPSIRENVCNSDTGIKPAVLVAERTQSGNLLDNAVAENVRRQVTRLKNSLPVVQKAYAGKKIDIVGGVYDLATGKVALV